MIHGREARAVGAARIASWTERNWPLPSAATTASAHAGQPGGGAAAAVAGRAARSSRARGAFIAAVLPEERPGDAARGGAPGGRAA